MLAILLVWATHLPAWIQLALTLTVLLSWFYTLNRQVLQRGHAAWRMLSLEGKQVTIGTHGGDELTGVVLMKTVVTRYFIIIWVRLDGSLKPASQIIFSDALRCDAFRELKTRLRLL